MKNALSTTPNNRSYLEAVIMGSQTLFADSRLTALSLENSWAAAFWCEGTSWCINQSSYFCDYRKNGPLTLFRLAEGGRRYLLSAANLEFRNARNRRLNMASFISRYPSIEPTIRSLVRHDWRAAFYFQLVEENERYEHSLNLMGLGISKIPNGLSVRDDLVLCENPITTLPPHLFVGGVLDIRRTQIIKIPATIHIGGEILAE